MNINIQVFFCIFVSFAFITDIAEHDIQWSVFVCSIVDLHYVQFLLIFICGTLSLHYTYNLL